MDLRKIKKLIELVEESGITELQVRSGEEEVRISRATQPKPSCPSPSRNRQQRLSKRTPRSAANWWQRRWQARSTGRRRRARRLSSHPALPSRQATCSASSRA